MNYLQTMRKKMEDEYLRQQEAWGGFGTQIKGGPQFSPDLNHRQSKSTAKKDPSNRDRSNENDGSSSLLYQN